MKPILLLIIIHTLLLSFHNHEINQYNKNESNLEKTLDKVENKLKIVYDKLNISSKNIDEFITKEYDNTIYTNSYIRFETSIEKRESNSVKIKPNIDIRIKLPKLKDKLSLTFNNNDNKINPNYQDSNEKINYKDDDYNVGILYNIIKRDINLKFRVGAKISFNPYLYVKAEAKKKFDLNQNNNLILEQKVKYSDKYEIDNYSSIRYNYKINKNYLFSNFNEYYINSKINDNNLYNSFRINHIISNDSYLNYVTSVDSNDDNSTFQTKRYGVYVSYRKYIRKWLYYDLLPNIQWKRDNDFNTNTGIKINIGIIIKK